MLADNWDFGWLQLRNGGVESDRPIPTILVRLGGMLECVSNHHQFVCFDAPPHHLQNQNMYLYAQENWWTKTDTFSGMLWMLLIYWNFSMVLPSWESSSEKGWRSLPLSSHNTLNKKSNYFWKWLDGSWPCGCHDCWSWHLWFLKIRL